jgi:hypothetical protein
MTNEVHPGGQRPFHFSVLTFSVLTSASLTSSRLPTYAHGLMGTIPE